MIETWHLWVVLAVLLFIAEAFLPGFIFVCVGLACLTAAVVAFLGLGLKAQIVGLIIGTLVSFFGVRPFFTRYFYRESGHVRTNVEALVGKAGLVTETIDNSAVSGRVTVGGDDWRALSSSGIRIEKGTTVKVDVVEGTKVFVTPV